MNPQCIDEGTLRAYIDGELNSTDSARVETHIADCSLCRLTLNEQRANASQASALLGTYLHTNPTEAESAFEQLKAQLPAMRATAGSSTTKATILPTTQPPNLSMRRNLPALVGLALAAALVAAFWLAGFFSRTPDGGLAGLSKGDFVPQGKVRHLVYTYTNESSSIDSGASTPTQEQEDVWLANGKDHLLMYRTISDHPDDWVLVNDDGAYTYSPNGTWALQGSQGFGPTDGPAIFKTPYDRRYIAWYLPGANNLPDLLQLTNVPLLGGGQINGRDTILIEALDNLSATTHVLPAGIASTVVQVNLPSQYFGAVTGPWGSAIAYNIEGTPMPSPTEIPTLSTAYFPQSIWSPRIDYRMWFDKQTNQLLQQQYVTRYTGDGEAGNILTRTIKLTQVDIIEQGMAPVDLFTVKPIDGAASVEAEVVFAPAILPADRYVPPTVNPLTSSRWYQGTWEQGGFSWLQNRDNTVSQNNGDWHRRGSIDGDIEYIAGYRDHSDVIPPDKLDAWLDTQIPEFAATMNGTVLRSYPTGPRDGRIGRELTIDRKDGRITLARVYALKQRMYFIYLTGPNLASFADERTDAYLNSLTISHP